MYDLHTYGFRLVLRLLEAKIYLEESNKIIKNIFLFSLSEILESLPNGLRT